MSSNNPFATGVAKPTAPVVEQTVTESVDDEVVQIPSVDNIVAVVKEKKTKKPDPNYRTITNDDMNFVIENWNKMKPSEIADHLKIGKSQVSQIAYKIRKTVNDKMESVREKMQDSDPKKAQILAALQAKKDLVPAREKGVTAGSGKGSVVDNYITNLLGDIQF